MGRVKAAMLRKYFAPLLRNRFGFPLIVAGALVILFVNEATYRVAVRTLDWGIALTDARIDASQSLQLLTDAETAQRGFLLTGSIAFQERYDKAVAELPKVLGPTLDFLREREGDSLLDADRLQLSVAQRLGELAASVALKSSGQQAASIDVIESGGGKSRMDVIRASFDTALNKAAEMQSGARISLYQSLFVNRFAVLTLTCLAVLGMYLFLRQLQELSRERMLYAPPRDRVVAARTDDLRALATHVMSVREDERQRLARELHDELGGLLTAAKLDLARMRSGGELPPALAERVQKINDRLNDGISLKRRIIEDLRPSALDQLGLTTSLSILCQDAAEGLGIEVEQVLEEIELAPDVSLTIYRLVQESLTNVRKYAKASRVVVRLSRPEHATVQVSVQDDGAGFDVFAASVGRHGLAGMRFRVEAHGGTMQITSSPGRGTAVSATLPARAVASVPDAASALAGSGA